MEQYHNLLKHVLEKGTDKGDRTGTGTRSVFGYQLRFNLQEGFPLVTTKKVHTKSIIHELLWFLSGSTNISYLKENKVKIWDSWANEQGELGPVYGKQWRNWTGFSFRSPQPNYDFPRREEIDGVERQCEYGDDGWIFPIDQISELIEGLIKNPNGRRHIVSAWNPSDVPAMALPPCHTMFQFYVADGKLSCQLYQRNHHCALSQ